MQSERVAVIEMCICRGGWLGAIVVKGVEEMGRRHRAM